MLIRNLPIASQIAEKMERLHKVLQNAKDDKIIVKIRVEQGESGFVLNPDTCSSFCAIKALVIADLTKEIERMQYNYVQLDSDTKEHERPTGCSPISSKYIGDLELVSFARADY